MLISIFFLNSRETASNSSWFIPQMLTIVRASVGQRLDPETLSRFPMQMAETQMAEPPLLSSRDCINTNQVKNTHFTEIKYLMKIQVNNFWIFTLRSVLLQSLLTGPLFVQHYQVPQQPLRDETL